MPKASLRALLVLSLALLGPSLLPQPARAEEKKDEKPAPAPAPATAPPDCNLGPFFGEHLTVELVAEETSFKPGTTPLVGLKFTLERHWHTYWPNPGESGLPPVPTWTLPEGWTPSEILWPTPELLLTGDAVSYGYEGTFVLPVRISVPAGAAEREEVLKVKLDWLVCDPGECLPGDGVLCLRIPVLKAEPKPAADRALFDEAKRLWPQPFAKGGAALAFLEKGMDLRLKGKGPWSREGAKVYLFAEQATETKTVGSKVEKKVVDVVDPRAKQAPRKEGDDVVLNLSYPKKRTKPPARLTGILSVEVDGKREGFAIALPEDAVEEQPPPDEEGQSVPLWLLLLGAFVGGMVLNIMPCVLPVLSIKILGFVSQAEEDPAKVRLHGYVFALGVLVPFWFLAGVLLLVRAGGESLGWGFQLQEPAFVAVLMAVMLGVGLNLAGVFEFGLSVMTLAGDAATKVNASGYTSSFLSGALATVIATPCTAPMMGPAVGYAVVAPAFECLLLFTMLGVGMALPYVVLSMSPRLLKKVPRPGAWMETFKHALAFPMFAVVIWLGLVFGGQVGVGGLSQLLFALLMLAIALWIYGHWGRPERSERVRWVVGRGVAALFVLYAGYLGVGAVNATEDTSNRWSVERVEEELLAGKVVFVDFTADWCVSCKANERLFIHVDEVYEAAKKYNVVMLVGDWTKKDKNGAIYREMQKYRRSSVPLYLVLSPHPGKKPIVLPTQLTSSQQLIDAFAEQATPLTSAAPPLPPNGGPK